ncbi:hypothetical protein [uncultured Tenacibaculum sp.]|uniref:hypothetical protein n=1 Tax=uncultured Tenacibaculum sp. TaxID=174713 RepID=UPI002627ADBD|nr:hypothetical protein [uncultured Tenacibaculum sp.]
MEVILNKLISNIKENIPGYIGVSVTEMSSGESLVSDSVVEGFDPELASAFNVEIINAKRKTMEILNISDTLNDIEFNLSDQVHVINISDSGEYFIYLALNKEKGNLGITRRLLSKYKEELSNEL